ncbi:MAG TPA: hypothetical protein VI792_03335 [Candidatus Eisenbacteria bacterium]
MAGSSEMSAPRVQRRAEWAAIAAGALAVLLVHLEIVVRRTGVARFTFDSAEYALAGRMLAHTGRLATPFAHPSVLASIPGPPFPLIVGHPLVPVLDALVFALGGARPALTLVPTAIAYLAAAVLTAALARRVSASRAVPWIAAGAFALSPIVLRFATEGLSELPFTALFAGALVLLWDLPERPRPFVLGLVLGLGHLARPVVVPLLPAWIAATWALSPPGRRGSAVGRLLAGFLPCAAALALYKWVAIGNPFADVAGYLLLARTAPGLTIARLNRTFPAPTPWGALAAHPAALLDKMVAHAPSLLYAAFTRTGRVIGALVLFRLVLPGAGRERVFRLTVLACALLLAALALATVPDPRMVLPLVPAFLALGLDEADRLARARGLGNAGALALGLALALGSSALPALATWRDAWREHAPAEGRFRESEWRDLGAALDRVLPREGLVASDAAPWIAWYAGRNATLVPLEPAMLTPMDRRSRIGAVALTNEWLIDQPGEEVWRAWFEGTARDPGWVRADSVSAGRLAAVVFVPRGAP